MSDSPMRGAAIWADSEWEDVAAFIGPRADAFRRNWEEMRAKTAAQGSGIALGFCWSAFAFGFAWFLYRRMWLAGLVLFALPALFAYFIDRSGGGTIGIAIVIGILAKGIYVQWAVKRIAAIKAAGGGRTEIAAAGGVSIIGGVIGGTLIVATMVAALLTFGLWRV